MNRFIDYDYDVSTVSLATYVPPGAGDAIHRNRRYHGIACNYSGIKQYDFDNGRTLTVKDNDIIYLPKYSNYVVKSLENGGCYAINFDFFTDRTFDCFSYKPRNQRALIELFQNADTMWRLKKTGYMMKCKADLYNILYVILSDYQLAYIQKDKADLILPAMEYIEENYTHGVIDIPHLASLCGISDAYFRRIFLRTYGMPPIQYINNLKITRAKELILSNYYSIHEAAVLSGYGDDSYFSREFKRHTGFSPMEYRITNG